MKQMGLGTRLRGLGMRLSWPGNEAIVVWERGYCGLGTRLSWPGNKAIVVWEQSYHGMQLELAQGYCTGH